MPWCRKMGNGNGVARRSKIFEGPGADRNRSSFIIPNFMWRRLFTLENLLALAFCLLVIGLIIVTTDSAPQWIYQGF